MWSDNDIDDAFQRLNPPEPEPTPFPLDAWLRLETQLDKAVIERAVRRRVWRLFAAEVAVVILAAIGWLLWPASPASPPSAAVATQALRRPIAAGNKLAVPHPAPATSLARPAATATPAAASSAKQEPTEPGIGAAALPSGSAVSASVYAATTRATQP